MKIKAKVLFRILLFLSIAIPLGFLLIIGLSFGPGSYPFAECYEIQSDEESVIKAVDIFFERNEQYCLPADSYLRDSQCERRGYWYHVYFYLPEENRYLYTWIRESVDIKATTFALVARSKRNLGPNNWSLINRELSWKENRRTKKEFKRQILVPIKDILNENRAD